MAPQTINDQRANSVSLLNELLVLAEKEFNKELRFETRIPFFRPVSVQMNGHSFSAFTRDVSTLGMGLLHHMELPLQVLSVKLPEQPDLLAIRIEWCESIGEGWYISGGTFLGSNG